MVARICFIKEITRANGQTHILKGINGCSRAAITHRNGVWLCAMHALQLRDLERDTMSRRSLPPGAIELTMVLGMIMIFVVLAFIL